MPLKKLIKKVLSYLVNKKLKVTTECLLENKESKEDVGEKIRRNIRRKKLRKVQGVVVSQVHETNRIVTNDKEILGPLIVVNEERKNNNQSNNKELKMQNKIKTLKLKHAIQKKEMTLLIKKYRNRRKILTMKLNKLKTSQPNLVQPTRPHITTVHILTDSPTSQYRN